MAGIKNLVRFAAKFLDMAKSKSKANVKGKGAKPSDSKSTKKVAKKAAKPAKKVATKPKKVVKAQKKSATASKGKVTKASIKKPKPVIKKKPVVKTQKKVTKPVAKATTPKATKQINKPIQKNTTKKKQHLNDVNMRYSDDELKEFKELIDKKLAAARDELKYLKEALDNHNDTQAGNKAWNMEEGTDTSEMETLMNQISRQHQYIRNLELALVRIENKTYGICRVTGRLIPKERLRVVPHATLSLEAKMSRKSDDVDQPVGASAPPADFAEGFED